MLLSFALMPQPITLSSVCCHRSAQRMYELLSELNKEAVLKAFHNG